MPFAISATLGARSEPQRGEGASTPKDPGARVPAPTIGSPEVMSEFSSRPMPEMRSSLDSTGELETDLVFPPSGRAGAVTLFTAQRVTAAWEASQASQSLNTLIKLPCESCVCELMVPAGWTDPGTARVSVYGRRGAVERVNDLRTVDLLPQRETLTCTVGVEGPQVLPHAQGHADAVRQAIKSAGWNDVKYDLYRCEVAYPVLHTMVRLAADSVRTC